MFAVQQLDEDQGKQTSSTVCFPLKVISLSINNKLGCLITLQSWLPGKICEITNE